MSINSHAECAPLGAILRRGNLLNLDGLADTAAYDLIFCRNLLIYFDETAQRIAIDALSRPVVLRWHAVCRTRRGSGLLPACIPTGGRPKRFRGEEKTATAAPTVAAASPAKKSSRLSAAEIAPAATAAGNADAANRPEKPVAAAKNSLRGKTARTPKPSAIAPERLLEQARRLADCGDFPAASGKFLAYLQAVPDSAEAYFMLGLISERSDPDKSTAEAYLRRSIYLQPDNYEALCHLALLTEQRGSAAAAANLRQRAARVFRRQAERPNKP